MYRSYQLRIKPNKEQAQLLNHTLEVSCELYNAALQERMDAWKVQRKVVGLFEQYKELTVLRHTEDNTATIASDICRDALHRVDTAMSSFFHRVRDRVESKKRGRPRYRSVARYNSFSALFMAGFRLYKDNRIHIAKLSTFHFRASQPIIGSPKQITLRRHGNNKWSICLVCDIGPAPAECKPSKNPVGIDLGTARLLTTSDGKQVANPKWRDQCIGNVAAAQKSFLSKKRGSKNKLKALEKLRRAHQRWNNLRNNHCHAVSNLLLKRYDGIVHEDFNISKMTTGSRYAKSIKDAAWGKLLFQLRYKAEEAGIPVIAVDPDGTTQRCSGCDKIVRKEIWDRVHNCTNCGLVLDRDVNAAINILKLGRSFAEAGMSLRNAA